MAGIACLQGTDHTTDFKQDSWKLISKDKKYGNMFQFMGCWQKLKEACINGTIKDLLQCLAEEHKSEERLGIGDFELCFSISMIHHRNCHSVNARKEIWNLLLKELDPDELVEDTCIKSIGIDEEKDIDKLMDCMSREQKKGFLLGRLFELMGADEGFEMLLDHCWRYSYEHILNERKVLYTAKVILNIGKKEATEVSDNRNVPDSEYITSLHIQDPKSYFDTIAEDVVPIEIHMKLEPALETTIEDVDDAVVDHENDMELAHDGDTTRDEDVKMDPDVPEDDKLVATNFNGDQGEKTENHSEPLTTDAKDITENLNANDRSNLEYMSFIHQQLHSIVSECEQQLDKRSLQKLKMLDESLEKHVKQCQKFMETME